MDGEWMVLWVCSADAIGCPILTSRLEARVQPAAVLEKESIMRTFVSFLDLTRHIDDVRKRICRENMEIEMDRRELLKMNLRFGIFNGTVCAVPIDDLRQERTRGMK